MRYQLLLSKDLGYINLKKYEELDNEAEVIKKMLSVLYCKVSGREQSAESSELEKARKLRAKNRR